MPRISVIIPVYNADKYLAECIESLKNQIFVDFEVILVNDGSTDRSHEIMLEISKNDQRFRMFDNKGKGVSCARNCGMDKAEGQFLAFLDSDDLISPLFLKTMHLMQKKNESQCVVVSFSLNQTEISLNTNSVMDYDIISGNTKSKMLFDDDNNIGGFVWNKMYITDIIRRQNIRFNDNISAGEDLLFNYNYFKYVTDITYCKTPLYYYRLNTNSAVNRLDNEKWFDLLKVHEMIMNDEVSTDISEYFSYKHQQLVLEGLFRIKYCETSPYTYKELNLMKRNFSGNWKILGIKKSIKIMLFRMFPSIAMMYKRRAIKG